LPPGLGATPPPGEEVWKVTDLVEAGTSFAGSGVGSASMLSDAKFITWREE
jgi:hypothetical protein